MARRRSRRLQRLRNARPRFAPRQRPRRGRQDEDVPDYDLNAVDGEEDYDAAAGDEAMEELYNGCDWKTNIGGFLNFCKWRKWCADNQGITDFGPYGGVPESCPVEVEGEEGAADDADLEAAGAEVEEVEAEAPPPEARRARARRGRKVAPRRKAAKKSFRKKASRKFRG